MKLVEEPVSEYFTSEVSRQEMVDIVSEMATMLNNLQFAYQKFFLFGITAEQSVTPEQYEELMLQVYQVNQIMAQQANKKPINTNFYDAKTGKTNLKALLNFVSNVDDHPDEGPSDMEQTANWPVDAAMMKQDLADQQDQENECCGGQHA